jgi:hypothetical protein
LCGLHQTDSVPGFADRASVAGWSAGNRQYDRELSVSASPKRVMSRPRENSSPIGDTRLCSLAVGRRQASWPSPNRRPAIRASIVKSDPLATERYSSTVRCSRKLLWEPQPPAQLLSWSGLPRSLIVSAKRTVGVRAGGCEPACSPRRYRPWRRSLLADGVAYWPSSSSSG